MADGIISKIQLPDNTIYDVVDNTSGYMTGMTILSYGSSTWQNFIDAYSSNKVVYCRASSNSNPATGSQTRLAFMAYVNNATTPTEVEFQYYRSVSTHTASQQGDQVFVYKLNKTNGWSVTVREASVKVVAGTGLGGTYSNGTMTLTGPTKVSDLTNDSGFITTETDPTVPSWAKQVSKPSYTASEVGALPDTTPIPSKTSDLVNDSGFITGVTSTSTPTASTIAEFDSTAHMNSTDMTSAEVSSFVGTLGYTFNLIDMFYPVGSYYETSDSTFNPNITWGGTWSLEIEGQVHISAGENYEVSGALTNETDGGEATVTLTIDEMPSHNHTQDAHSHQIDNYVSSGATATWTTENVNKKHGYDHWTSSAQPYIQPKGGGQAHENMPPYIVVNRWHRTA